MAYYIGTDLNDDIRVNSNNQQNGDNSEPASPSLTSPTTPTSTTSLTILAASACLGHSCVDSSIIARERAKRSLKRFVSRDPNACQLCGFVNPCAPPSSSSSSSTHDDDHANDSTSIGTRVRECPRCGLSASISHEVKGNSPYYFTEAAAAHRIKQFGLLTPLPKELVDLVGFQYSDPPSLSTLDTNKADIQCTF
jgi:hypothetical protein